MQTPNGYGHLGHNSLCVEYKAIESLQSYALNARTHSPKQIRQIAESIKTFGFNNPVLIDNDGTLIAGHARMEAARMAGMDYVPVIYLRHLSPAQKRAYIIADNKLAENAGWDFEILSGELQAILELDVEIDLTLTGFETGEIDTLLVGAQTIDAQEVIPDPPDSPVSRPGDIWVLGKHRLICADARRLIEKIIIYPDKIRLIQKSPDGLLREHDVVIQFRRYGGRRLIVDQNGRDLKPSKTHKDSVLIKALVRAHTWDRALQNGTMKSLDEIARSENIGRSYVRQIYNLVFLSPDIQAAILEGGQPRTLMLSRLMKGNIPLSWSAQKEAFGF